MRSSIKRTSQSLQSGPEVMLPCPGGYAGISVSRSADPGRLGLYMLDRYKLQLHQYVAVDHESLAVPQFQLGPIYFNVTMRLYEAPSNPIPINPIRRPTALHGLVRYKIQLRQHVAVDHESLAVPQFQLGRSTIMSRGGCCTRQANPIPIPSDGQRLYMLGVWYNLQLH
jgi:hypothetical protein